MIQAARHSHQASDAAAWLGGNIDDALFDIRVPAFILDRDAVIRWQNARATNVVARHVVAISRLSSLPMPSIRRGSTSPSR